jgi:hypothetical protein
LLSLQQSVKEYLARVGQIDGVPLDDKTPSAADSVFLRSALTDSEAFNNWLLGVVVALLCSAFVISCLFIFRYRDSLTAVATITGLQSFSLVGLIGWLRRLWIDKNTTDLFKNASNRLTPEQTVALVSAYYHLMMEKSQ